MDVDCEPPHSSTASPSPLLQPPPSTHDSSCICSECAEHDSAHVQPQGLDECERVLPAVNGGVSTLATAQPSPPTLLPPTPIRLSVSSFTSHPAVVNALYPTVSPHPGLAVWSLHESDFPLTTAEPHHKPLYFDAITHIKAAAEHMPAIPFNLPDRGSSGDCKDEQPQPTDPRVLTDVLALVKEGRDNTADEKPEMALYQKDIPFSAWQPTEQQPMAPQPQQQQQQQQQPQEQPQQQQPEQTPPPIRSPFNPHLFVHEPTNLSCLMDDHDFPGFTTPSWYVKKPGSFFCMHVEQLFAPFYNLCYDGSTTWWVVQRDTRGKLNDYMVRRARRLYGVPEDVKLSEEEAEAVHGLLFTKQVMFHPDDLIRAGVVLSEVKQEAGMVVVGDGDVVHLGMTTVASSEQRAVTGESQRERGHQLPAYPVAHYRPARARRVDALAAAFMAANATPRRHGARESEEAAGCHTGRAHQPPRRSALRAALELGIPPTAESAVRTQADGGHTPPRHVDGHHTAARRTSAGGGGGQHRRRAGGDEGQSGGGVAAEALTTAGRDHAKEAVCVSKQSAVNTNINTASTTDVA